MAKLSSSIIAFAAGDNETLKLMEGYQDYWHQYQAENVKNGHKHTFATTNAQTGQPITFAEKEQALNAAMIRYIEKHSGLSFSSTPIEQAITHPLVAWFAVNLVSQMIDAVLPETILDSIAEISEVRQIGLGDTAIFDIKPRDLFPVSKSGRLGMRVAEIHKGYNGQTTLNPEMRTVTVGVSLFRLLTGQESLADFTVKVMRSIETDMSRDVYNAFSTAMAALYTGDTGLKVAGYSQKDLV